MASAAPVYAASPCPAVTLTYSGIGTYTGGTVGGVTVTFAATGDTGAANNQTVSNVATGGQSNNLRFYLNSSTTRVVSETVTVNFTSPVQNLIFSFLDIDSASTGLAGTLNWSDRIAISAAGVGTIVSTANVTGSGTAGTPWAPNGTNTQVAGTSSNGNVNVNFGTAQISTFSFTYSQPIVNVANTPFIGISNLTFRPVLC